MSKLKVLFTFFSLLKAPSVQRTHLPEHIDDDQNTVAVCELQLQWLHLFSWHLQLDRASGRTSDEEGPFTFRHCTVDVVGGAIYCRTLCAAAGDGKVRSVMYSTDAAADSRSLTHSGSFYFFSARRRRQRISEQEKKKQMSWRRA